MGSNTNIPLFVKDNDESPYSVAVIWEFSFDSNSLTSITIPNNVTILENRAFANNSLTSIGSSTFLNNSLTVLY